jgi:hypothetical protein
MICHFLHCIILFSITIYIYIYICVCVCVYVCIITIVYVSKLPSLYSLNLNPSSYSTWISAYWYRVHCIL